MSEIIFDYTKIKFSPRVLSHTLTCTPSVFSFPASLSLLHAPPSPPPSCPLTQFLTPLPLSLSLLSVSLILSPLLCLLSSTPAFPFSLSWKQISSGCLTILNSLTQRFTINPSATASYSKKAYFCFNPSQPFENLSNGFCQGSHKHSKHGDLDMVKQSKQKSWDKINALQFLNIRYCGLCSSVQYSLLLVYIKSKIEDK